MTGAGAGLGRSYALALAARGARVLVNDIGARLDGSGSDDSLADSVVAEIVERGGIAAADHTSVATPEGGEGIVEHAVAEFGGVDVLVNNAGNMRLSSFAKLDLRSIHEILDVHLGGAFYVTQPAYKVMMEQRRGRIIFTTSGLAIFGIYGASVYAAAKGGVFGLMNVLELEGRRYGIKVNAVAPMARTRMSGDDLYSELPQEFVGPEHVAPVIEYLASDGCEPSGEVWSVGAGSVARIVTGRAAGYFKHPRNEGPLTAEDIAAHLTAVGMPADLAEPDDWPAEWKMIVDLFEGANGG